MPRIFLSYRRMDSAAAAGRIYDRLCDRFGEDAVFMDIDTIPFGADFRQHITSALDQCGVLLAVIGHNWAGEAGAPRRIDDPQDFVRIEIESALERNLPVIPILIDRAAMPGEADLPPSLSRLAYRNAIEVDQGRDFRHHVDRLIRGIEQLLQQAQPQPGSPQPMGEWTNSIGIKLKLIPAGEFLMGSPESDSDAEDDEKPQHRVRITQPFYLGIHQVTVRQYQRFIEATGYRTEAEEDGEGGWGWDAGAGKPVQNPKFTWRSRIFNQTDEHPVVNVSWNDAKAFCDWLSQREGQTYGLPTEAQWESACRAGTTTRFSFGDDEDALGEYAWYSANSGGRTHPVGEKKPNGFGLHDMHGNVWEWCWDGYGNYQRTAVDDPRGAEGASRRVIRGGSWSINPRVARSAGRLWLGPGNRGGDLGFRVARGPSGR
jgi:formylglycine-generating enzyme required for sulfatase activity